MVIVSHLNANAENGMQWLDDVVIPGLREGGGGDCGWDIEVHGSDEEEPTDDENEETTSEGPGPAVYIIHKKQTRSEEKLDKDNPLSITLRFLSY